MRQKAKGVKRHIISLRVSAEEWDTLHEIMKGLQFKRVSDLMREAFKQVLTPPDELDSAATQGQKRTG